MRTENGCHSEETALQEYIVVFSVSVCLHGFVAVLHEIGFLVEMLAITLVTSQSFEVCAKLAVMKASSRLAQSLLGSLLIGEDHHSREVT